MTRDPDRQTLRRLTPELLGRKISDFDVPKLTLVPVIRQDDLPSIFA